MFVTTISSVTLFKSGMRTAKAQAKADAIPRYAEPAQDEEEPREGMCYNCDHRTCVTLGGKEYMLCVQERDDSKGGEVYECDPEETECADWDWDGYDL